MKKTNFFILLVCLLSTGCYNGNELELNSEENLQHYEQENRAYYKSIAAKKGIDSKELERNLEEYEKDEVSEILLNKPGTTQEELDYAVTLLHRLKKEDYEQVYLLYLEKRYTFEQTKNYVDKDLVLRDYKNRITYYKELYEKSINYQQSYLRLPKEERLKLTSVNGNELRQETVGATNASERGRDFGFSEYCGQYVNCTKYCMNEFNIYEWPGGDEYWLFYTITRSTCGENYVCGDNPPIVSGTCDVILFYPKIGFSGFGNLVNIRWASTDVDIAMLIIDQYGNAPGEDGLSGFVDQMNTESSKLTIGTSVNNIFWGYERTAIANAISLAGQIGYYIF